jgi:hypothetical protein
LPAQTRYFFSKYGQFLHVFVRRFDAQKSLGASSGHHFVLAWGAFWCPGSGHQPKRRNKSNPWFKRCLESAVDVMRRAGIASRITSAQAFRYPMRAHQRALLRIAIPLIVSTNW